MMVYFFVMTGTAKRINCRNNQTGTVKLAGHWVFASVFSTITIPMFILYTYVYIIGWYASCKAWQANSGIGQKCANAYGYIRRIN